MVEVEARSLRSLRSGSSDWGARLLWVQNAGEPFKALGDSLLEGWGYS
jgi:hypothetical protein